MFPQDTLTIGGKVFTSRLMLGTGKFTDFHVMRDALEASGTQIVTVAIRRVELKAPGHVGLLDALDLSRYQLLPNTAGCRTAEEAVRVARLARAATGVNWVKLEVIPDPRWLLPDPIGTLKAAEILVGEGFTVLPYVQPDAVLARALERVGCATVMPLASPIGSGRGLRTGELLRTVLDGAGVPIVVDAGLGVPSDAAQALEAGADAVLVNTAVAEARDPVGMAQAFALGVQAGRAAFLAGRMAERTHASPSSPAAGVPCLPDPEVPV
ncbi:MULTISPECIES: thiazole synthase [Deinococcus]|uniref:Thiazole synthase n=1 Tax=Deinococcus geothermalis (strain DSM 11300 / CIP 105573 / AG-3a) TaxID=319795 RepID=THIG_DEIGD|nr:MULTISPECIES: thiazole synthase [Deinococcus]Q1IX18.1 RecName: Full=Thiazole synthase [Deinococcus geothermalis DSM 11300]ABF46216.1 thiazole-phosphate synthase [Deinococcus geothermalis DSM 11300]MBI0444678.1 thiazole synthase [Deinococcus sp. DB0503]